MSKNIKAQKNTASILIVGSIIWFCVIAFIMTQTQYQSMIANELSAATQIRSILSTIIVIISLTPSGVMLAYPYITRTFKEYQPVRIVGLGLIIACALLMPFSWYNFVINFSR